jgi:hypothetical protein
MGSSSSALSWWMTSVSRPTSGKMSAGIEQWGDRMSKAIGKL